MAELIWRVARDLRREATALPGADWSRRHPGVAVVAEPYTGKPTDTPGTSRICWPVGDAIRFGRKAGWATVVLPHPRISKEHLTLKKVGAAWGILDHGSSNGTIFKGKPLEAHMLAEVAAGEPVDVGEALRLRFYFEPQALQAALAALAGNTGAVPREPVPHREDLPRLATTLRSLGYGTEYREEEGVVRVESGTDEVLARVKAGQYVVECIRNGLCVRTAGTPTFGDDAEDRLRDLVLRSLGFGKDRLQETDTELELP
jgi:hypothetical protein